MQRNPFATVNTFTQKPSLPQIVSYVIVLGQILIYFLCIHPNLNSITARTTLATIFGLGSTVLIIAGFITSYIDPTDPVVRNYLISRQGRVSFENVNYLYCGTCESYCHQTSKHCRTCGRCVNQFDHHCIWINNCIGSANYKVFFVMIASAMTQLATYVTAAIYLSVQANFQPYLGSMIIVWIFMAITAVLLFLDFNLVLLHIYLMYKGITTFTLIMAQRQQERKAKRQEEEKRRVEIRQKNVAQPMQQLKQEATVQVKISAKHKQTTHEKDQQPKNNQEEEIHRDEESKASMTDGLKSSDKKFLQLEQNHDEVVSIGKVSESDNNDKEQKSEDKLQESKESEILQFEELKISKFFSKNKSLRLMFDGKDVDNPRKLKTTRNNLSYAG